MGQLSTHVLDTARGQPAAGLEIKLWRISGFGHGETRTLLTTATTNADGRTDAPLLAGDAFSEGVFELEFGAAAYLRQHASLPDPPFLGQVIVRFGVGDASMRYHVPLLLSPYGYSTYRGS